jgi:signal transduction histidine kinase
MTSFMIEPAAFHSCKILIVDDQECDVRLLERVLSSNGYTSVASTTNPHEVCDLYRKNRYDLILLDLEMPGMDGFQVMAGLKEIEGEGYIPVLVTTAQPDHKLRALQGGAKDFISKPFDFAEMLARVGNILEMRMLQQVLHDYNDLLELRVQELTRANEKILQETAERIKAEEKLRQKNQLLAEMVEELESFSYSVSHDLRAPLLTINSYAAILEEDFGGSLLPGMKVYLDRIRGSSRRMGILIDDLLKLSHIGMSELCTAPVSLSRLACGIALKLQEAEPKRRVEFVIEPELTVHGDKGLLRQLLENLMGNAWKYSGRRESSRIEVGRGREGFFVKDNGIGFDMAHCDSLFGAFQRLHGEEFEGSGIGLATVKRIITRHNGSVWAEATVGEGATFHFTLPSVSDMTAVAESPSRSADYPGRKSAVGDKLKK